MSDESALRSLHVPAPIRTAGKGLAVVTYGLVFFLVAAATFGEIMFGTTAEGLTAFAVFAVLALAPLAVSVYRGNMEVEEVVGPVAAYAVFALGVTVLGGAVVFLLEVLA